MLPGLIGLSVPGSPKADRAAINAAIAAANPVNNFGSLNPLFVSSEELPAATAAATVAGAPPFLFDSRLSSKSSRRFLFCNSKYLAKFLFSASKSSFPSSMD